MAEYASDPDNISENIGRNEEEDQFSPDDELLTIKKKFIYYFCFHWRGLICTFLPIILIPIQLSFPPKGYEMCAYTLELMAIFWVTECIPLAVTSFLPVVIFPLTGIMSTAETCACYMNDSIMMFLASMWLAYAIEQSGLHIRLAHHVIRCVGYSHYKLLFSMSFTTMFVSIWITNTAATTMMVPINFAILKVFEDQNLLQIYDEGSHGEKVASDIATCYFCAATLSASIGGIGSLVGTATNLVFKELFTRLYPDAPEYLSFPKFSAFTIPFMVIMELFCYLYLIIVYFGYLRPKSKAARNAEITESGMEAAKQAVEEKIKEIGSVTTWEIFVLILFTGAILLFFSRSPQIFVGWGDAISNYFGIEDVKFVRDSAAAIFVVFLMLLIPSSLKFYDNFRAKAYEDFPDKQLPSVLLWDKMNEVMPYSFMFLLGGGFALSKAAKSDYTDLNGKIGNILKNFKYLPNPLVLLLIIIVTVFITNFASNVAVCNVIVPIAMQLAREINRSPLWYNLAAGLSSSYAFCVPVGTPGNLIVQGAANIPSSKMIKAGIGVTFSSIFVTWLAVCFWAPIIWPDLST
ncbi:protein I'm not dead yet-like isoform X1 [Danaus plexippus]|uniref:protein I'm not dead yet-like isoform X1 n=1 Tax=Danaus plexippus TaxID=13037 RepID=UPI0013C538F5|nr:protein I'm not dead yet-like isoform X1 [Danaus plexippus]